ncbi:MAG: hypothetical protein FWE17_01065 [Alphaproteobacteria bacterium]|nr:hypothetical protein [Alphaproteobacteria bacterium]MCL2758437.1 hypothetical protein [Alphaproteobacteria bacterium]
MHAKYAFRHCSYAMPVRVSGTAALRATVALRASAADAGRAADRAGVAERMAACLGSTAVRALIFCGVAARVWTAGAADRPPSPRLRAAGAETAADATLDGPVSVAVRDVPVSTVLRTDGPVASVRGEAAVRETSTRPPSLGPRAAGAA